MLHGIEITTAVPHEHHLIPIVERSNRTVQDAVNKALNLPVNSHLSSQFWAMALKDAIFKYNMKPHSSNPTSSPFSDWHNGRKIDLSTTPMLPFGTIVMAHNPLSLQTSLNGRSFVTYFVGCAPGFRGGLVLFNPATKRTVIRRTFKVIGQTPQSHNYFKLPATLEAIDDVDEEALISTDVLDEPFDAVDDPAEVPTAAPTLAPATPLPVITPATHVQRKQHKNKSKCDIPFTDEVIAEAIHELMLRLHPVKAGSVRIRNNTTHYLARQKQEKYIKIIRKRLRLKHKLCNSDLSTWRLALESELAGLLGADTLTPAAATAMVSSPSKYTSVGLKAVQRPLSMKQAILRPDKDEFVAAKNGELESMRKHNVFKIPDIPLAQIPKDRILPSQLILDRLLNADGSYKKHKARLVIRGDKWVDENGVNTYAGTVQSESIRIFMAIVAELDLDLEGIDVKTAFLYSPLSPGELIYMRRPPGLTDEDMPEVVQLNKCIYGLPEASARFREHSNSTLQRIGFRQIASDNCVYRFDKGDSFVIATVFVDDIAFATNDSLLLAGLKDSFEDTYDITSVKDLTFYLGLHIVRDRLNKSITLLQDGYIDSLIEKYSLDTSPPFFPSTPMVMSITEVFDQRSPQHRDLLRQPLSPSDTSLYRSKIGSLLYLATQTRPDILFAVTTLARKTQDPCTADMLAADRALLFVVGSRNLGLHLHSGEGIRLYATVDASYGTHTDSKSHTGVTLHIGRHSGSIQSISRKQTIVADSSTFAEFIAAHTAGQEILWARNFLAELGFPQIGPTTLFEDNKSTIVMMNSDSNGKRSRHIDIRFNMIRDLIKRGLIVPQYLETENMISDMLTKATGPTLFHHLQPMILGSQDKLLATVT
jgi:hypothetical protein